LIKNPCDNKRAQKAMGSPKNIFSVKNYIFGSEKLIQNSLFEGSAFPVCTPNLAR